MIKFHKKSTWYTGRMMKHRISSWRLVSGLPALACVLVLLWVQIVQTLTGMVYGSAGSTHRGIVEFLDHFRAFLDGHTAVKPYVQVSETQPMAGSSRTIVYYNQPR